MFSVEAPVSYISNSSQLRETRLWRGCRVNERRSVGSKENQLKNTLFIAPKIGLGFLRQAQDERTRYPLMVSLSNHNESTNFRGLWCPSAMRHDQFRNCRTEIKIVRDAGKGLIGVFSCGRKEAYKMQVSPCGSSLRPGATTQCVPKLHLRISPVSKARAQ